MRTVEQRKTNLRAQLTTKNEFIEFAKDWSDGHYIAGDEDDATFIKTNIDEMVDKALEKDRLIQLGAILGVSFGNDIKMGWLNARSWAAFGFSIVALIVAVLAIRLNDERPTPSVPK